MESSQLKQVWGEWPCGLRHCDKNWKVPGTNPTRNLAGLRDPTLLHGSWWPSVWNSSNTVINIRLVRLCPWEWPKSWPWGSQIAVKKKLRHFPNWPLSFWNAQLYFFEYIVFSLISAAPQNAALFRNLTDHNLTMTKFKYMTYKELKISNSSGMFKTIDHNDSYLLLLGIRKLLCL